MSKELENKEIGADLCKLSALLQTYKLCGNIDPLQKAGSYCLATATENKWGYTLEKIVFIADEVGGRMAADTTDITVSLTIDIEGTVQESNDIYNPLKKLFFDIEIDGWRVNSSINDLDFVYSAWHLDRHLIELGGLKTKYSHPLYHFAFGGEKMEAKGHDIYGNSIILPSPRLLYPPMDAVLGIDFILQNYIHKDQIQPLVEDPEYIEIVKKAQERIWKPFFCAMYSYWNKGAYNVDSNFTPLMLFPLYY